MLAVTLGISDLKRPSLRQLAALVIALSFFTSDILYFRRENFLNLGYVAPLPEIADTLNREAQPGDVILVDSYNTDFQALAQYLSGRTRVIILDPASISNARKAASSAATVWIVRNTRDISPGGLTPRIRSEACEGRPRRETLLEPYAAWQEVAMRIAGFRPPPAYFYEITACGPRAGGGNSIKLENGAK